MKHAGQVKLAGGCAIDSKGRSKEGEGELTKEGVEN